MPRFGVALMNPPYSRTVYQGILQHVQDVSDMVVCVSPVTVYKDIRACWSGSHATKYLQAPGRKHLVTIEDIPPRIANNCFGAYFHMPIGIQVYDMSTTVQNDNVCYYTGISRPDILRRVVRKSMEDSCAMHTAGTYLLPIPDVHGHPDSDDMLLFLSKSFERQAASGGKSHVGFESEEEAREFHAFWTSKYGMALTRVWKVTLHVHPQYIPYFRARPGHEEQDIQDYFGLDREELGYLLSLV